MDPSTISAAQGVQFSGGVILLAKVFGTWIYGIFGTVPPGAIAGAANTTAITDMAQVIIGGGWAMYLMIALYTAVTALIKTGQTSEALGGDWDKAWLFIRHLGAIAMIFPTSSVPGVNTPNGVSLGQILTLKVAMYASAAADMIWAQSGGQIINNYIQDQSKQIQPDWPSIQANAGTTYLQDIQKGYCIQKYLSDNGTLMTLTDLTGKGNGNQVSSDLGNTNNLGKTSQPVRDNDATATADNIAKSAIVQPAFDECGYDSSNLTHHFVGLEGSNNDAANLQATTTLVQGSVFGTTNFTPFIARYQATLQSQGWALSITALEDGFQIYQNMSGSSPQWTTDQVAAQEQIDAQKYASQYVGDARTQQTTMTNALAAAAVEAVEVHDEQGGGWVGAANAFEDLNTYSGVVTNALNDATSTMNSANPSGAPPACGADDKWYNPMKYIHQAGCMTSPGELFGQFVTKIGISSSTMAVPNPFATYQYVGRQMGGVATWLWALSVVPFIGSLALKLSGYCFILCVVFAVILPAIPQIYFLTGVARWLVYVVMAFLINPFWTAAWAAPEGKHHMSQLAAKGYNNFLFIVLYPIFLVMGYVSAIVLSSTFLFMVEAFVGSHITEMTVSTTTQAVGTTGVTAMATGGNIGLGVATGLNEEMSIIPQLLGWVFLWAVLSWMMLTTAFNLVHTMGTEMLSWISASEPGTTPFGRGQEHGVGGMALGSIKVGGSRDSTKLAGALPKMLADKLKGVAKVKGEG